MRRTMTNKVICLVVAIAFLVNDLCYGLGISPIGTQPAKMTTANQQLLDAKLANMTRGQELVATISDFRSNPFPEGAPAEINGIKSVPVLEGKETKVSFVESFKRPIHVTNIAEAYKIMRHALGTGEVFCDEDLAQAWEYIKEHDLRYEITVGSEATATKETISLADCMLQWLHDYINGEKSRLHEVNDAVMLWFMASYASQDDNVRYSNAALDKLLTDVLNIKETEESGLRKLFPGIFDDFKDSAPQDKVFSDKAAAKKFIEKINYDFFSREGITPVGFEAKKSPQQPTQKPAEAPAQKPQAVSAETKSIEEITLGDLDEVEIDRGPLTINIGKESPFGQLPKKLLGLKEQFTRIVTGDLNTVLANNVGRGLITDFAKTNNIDLFTIDSKEDSCIFLFFIKVITEKETEPKLYPVLLGWDIETIDYALMTKITPNQLKTLNIQDLSEVRAYDVAERAKAAQEKPQQPAHLSTFVDEANHVKYEFSDDMQTLQWMHGRLNLEGAIRNLSTELFKLEPKATIDIEEFNKKTKEANEFDETSLISVRRISEGDFLLTLYTGGSQELFRICRMPSTEAGAPISVRRCISSEPFPSKSKPTQPADGGQAAEKSTGVRTTDNPLETPSAPPQKEGGTTRYYKSPNQPKSAAGQVKKPLQDDKPAMPNQDVAVVGRDYLYRKVFNTIYRDKSISEDQKDKLTTLWSELIAKNFGDKTNVSIADVEKALAGKSDSRAWEIAGLGIIVAAISTAVWLAFKAMPKLGMVTIVAGAITAVLTMIHFYDKANDYGRLAAYLEEVKEDLAANAPSAKLAADMDTIEVMSAGEVAKIRAAQIAKEVKTHLEQKNFGKVIPIIKTLVPIHLYWKQEIKDATSEISLNKAGSYFDANRIKVEAVIGAIKNTQPQGTKFVSSDQFSLLPRQIKDTLAADFALVQVSAKPAADEKRKLGKDVNVPDGGQNPKIVAKVAKRILKMLPEELVEDIWRTPDAPARLELIIDTLKQQNPQKLNEFFALLREKMKVSAPTLVGRFMGFAIHSLTPELVNQQAAAAGIKDVTTITSRNNLRNAVIEAIRSDATINKFAKWYYVRLWENFIEKRFGAYLTISITSVEREFNKTDRFFNGWSTSVWLSSLILFAVLPPCGHLGLGWISFGAGMPFLLCSAYKSDARAYIIGYLEQVKSEMAANAPSAEPVAVLDTEKDPVLDTDIVASFTDGDNTVSVSCGKGIMIYNAKENKDIEESPNSPYHLTAPAAQGGQTGLFNVTAWNDENKTDKPISGLKDIIASSFEIMNQYLAIWDKDGIPSVYSMETGKALEYIFEEQFDRQVEVIRQFLKDNNVPEDRLTISEEGHWLGLNLNNLATDAHLKALGDMGLTALTILYAVGGNVSDISPCAKITNLTTLYVWLENELPIYELFQNHPNAMALTVVNDKTSKVTTWHNLPDEYKPAADEVTGLRDAIGILKDLATIDELQRKSHKEFKDYLKNLCTHSGWDWKRINQKLLAEFAKFYPAYNILPMGPFNEEFSDQFGPYDSTDRLVLFFEMENGKAKRVWGVKCFLCGHPGLGAYLSVSPYIFEVSIKDPAMFAKIVSEKTREISDVNLRPKDGWLEPLFKKAQSEPAKPADKSPRGGQDSKKPSDLALTSKGRITGISGYTIKNYIEAFFLKEEQKTVTSNVSKALKRYKELMIRIDASKLTTEESHILRAVIEKRSLNITFNAVINAASENEASKPLKNAGYRLRKLLMNPTIKRADPRKNGGVIDIIEAVKDALSFKEIKNPDYIIPTLEVLKVIVDDNNSDLFYTQLMEACIPGITVSLAPKESIKKRIKNVFILYVLQLLKSGSVLIADYEIGLSGAAVLDEIPLVEHLYKKNFAGKTGRTSGDITLLGNPKDLRNEPESRYELQEAFAHEVLVHFLYNNAREPVPHSTINGLSEILADIAKTRGKFAINGFDDVKAIVKKFDEVLADKIPLKEGAKDNFLDLAMPSENGQDQAEGRKSIQEVFDMKSPDAAAYVMGQKDGAAILTALRDKIEKAIKALPADDKRDAKIQHLRGHFSNIVTAIISQLTTAEIKDLAIKEKFLKGLLKKEPETPADASQTAAKKEQPVAENQAPLVTEKIFDQEIEQIKKFVKDNRLTVADDFIEADRENKTIRLFLSRFRPVSLESRKHGKSLTNIDGLKGLATIKELWLNGNDELKSISVVESMPNIEELNISDTKIPFEKVYELLQKRHEIYDKADKLKVMGVEPWPGVIVTVSYENMEQYNKPDPHQKKAADAKQAGFGHVVQQKVQGGDSVQKAIADATEKLAAKNKKQTASDSEQPKGKLSGLIDRAKGAFKKTPGRPVEKNKNPHDLTVNVIAKTPSLQYGKHTYDDIFAKYQSIVGKAISKTTLINDLKALSPRLLSVTKDDSGRLLFEVTPQGRIEIDAINQNTEVAPDSDIVRLEGISAAVMTALREALKVNTIKELMDVTYRELVRVPDIGVDGAIKIQTALSKINNQEKYTGPIAPEVTRLQEATEQTKDIPLVGAIKDLEIPVELRVSVTAQPMREILPNDELLGIFGNVDRLHGLRQSEQYEKIERVEIFYPKRTGMTKMVDDIFRKINESHKKYLNNDNVQDIVNCRLYDTPDNLEKMLAVPAALGVRRVVIFDEEFGNTQEKKNKNIEEFIKKFNDLDCFKNARFFNTQLRPNWDDLKGEDNKEKSFYQAEIMIRALLIGIVDKDSSDMEKMVLANMLDGFIEGEPDEFVRNLIKEEGSDWTTVDRLKYFLGKTVSLLPELARQFEIMRLRMRTFYIAA